MIKTISAKILTFILKNSDIDEKISEIYQYGIEITLSSILNITLIILCSLIIGDIILGCVFLICFIALRSYSGGYHADTYFKCNVIFTLSFFFVVGFSRSLFFFFGYDFWIYGGITGLAFIPLLLFSPVQNIHKLLSSDQKRCCRKKSIAIFSLLTLLGFLLIICENYYGLIIIITDVIVSAMILIEIFMQRRKDHENQEAGF